MNIDPMTPVPHPSRMLKRTLLIDLGVGAPATPRDDSSLTHLANAGMHRMGSLSAQDGTSLHAPPLKLFRMENAQLSATSMAHETRDDDAGPDSDFDEVHYTEAEMRYFQARHAVETAQILARCLVRDAEIAEQPVPASLRPYQDGEAPSVASMINKHPELLRIGAVTPITQSVQTTSTKHTAGPAVDTGLPARRVPPPPPPRRPTPQRSPTRVPTAISQLHSTFNITRKES